MLFISCNAKCAKHDGSLRRHSLLCDTFIPDDFISLILDKTKSYIDTKPWNTKWKLNKGDIYQFFAILYFMGYHKLPSKSDYWEDNKGLTPCSPVCIQRGMSFRKFQFIWRNIYAITPQENEPNVGDLNEDPTEDECREWMKKAAPFISLLNKVSKLVYLDSTLYSRCTTTHTYIYIATTEEEISEELMCTVAILYSFSFLYILLTLVSFTLR